MAKKITLETLAGMIGKMYDRFDSVDGRFDALEQTMAKGFAAVAEDLADIRDDMTGMATKDQMIALHLQVNSIESQLRGEKRGKLAVRVSDLEEEVFGKSRR